MNTDVDALKRNCPMPVLLHRMNLGEFAKNSCRSPFREDKKPSWGIFQRDRKWFFKDQATGDSGDEITLLARWKGLDEKRHFPQLVKLYSELAGIPLNRDGRQLSGASRTAKESKPFSWPTCVAAFTPTEAAKLAARRGYSSAFCAWLTAENLIGLYEGNWALPVHGEAGAVIGTHYRVDRGNGEKPDWFYHPKGIGSRALVVGDPKQAANGFVFESPWDAFSLMDKLGWHKLKGVPDTSIVITRGSGNGKLVAGLFTSATTVYAFKQNDETKDGKNAANQWLADVSAHAGCKVFHVVTPARFKDLNDWMRAGATSEDIMGAIQEARLVEGPMPESTVALLNDSRPKVQLPGDNRLLSEFAYEVGGHLAKVDLFRRDAYAVLINSRRDGLEVMTPEVFRTWIEQHLVCFKVRQNGEIQLLIDRTMTQEDAGALLRSQQFLAELRPIERFNTVRLPIMRPTGRVELLPRGYDAEAKVFTADSLSYRQDMSLADAKAILDALFAEFVFADIGRSKAVAIGAMLTVYAFGLLPPKSIRPVFLAVANDIGAGKTTILKFAVLPVCGHARLKSEPKDDDEIRKSLLVAVMEARPYVFFDNVKGHLSSPSLEAFASATAWEDRILGKSRTFAGENCSTVLISGNSLTVSPDMHRRSLFIELIQEHERPEDRQYKRTLDDNVLLKMSGDILAALWALVREWDAAGQQEPSRSSASFPTWASVIGGIVEHAGYGCALETAKLEASGDRDAADMHTLVCAATVGKAYNFGELVELARSHGCFESLLPGTSETSELDPKQKSRLGNLFRRYHRRLFNEGERKLRFGVDGKGHKRRFAVTLE